VPFPDKARPCQEQEKKKSSRKIRTHSGPLKPLCTSRDNVPVPGHGRKESRREFLNRYSFYFKGVIQMPSALVDRKKGWKEIRNNKQVLPGETACNRARQMFI
jgi:hypothetical protein